MFRTGKWAAAVTLVGASVWAGFALTAQEPKPTPSARAADLTALREAVAAAAKRGDNVDEVQRALTALEKALPSAKAGQVPDELRALRDAVEAAAKKGENMDAVQKELAAVETAIAGRSFAPPKPVPQPPATPQSVAPRFPPPAFPAVPVLPDNLEPLLPGRINPEAFQKANELRMKALDLMLKNPNDPEARKLTAEANDLMLKSLLPNLKNLDGFNGAGGLLPPPNFGRAPERARLGIRFEALSPVLAEQLGLDADVGIAVAAVLPESAAERAGLKVHDIVLEFAGKPVSGNADEFVRQVNAIKAGEKFSIVVMRKSKKVEIKGVVLPDLNNPEIAPQLLGRPASPNKLPNLPREDGNPAQPQRAKPIPLPPAPNPIPNPVPPIPEKSEDTNIRAEAEQEPAKADLTDLRDAVTVAAKRGDNVDDIRKALTALEKALANSAATKGEAPPELANLREAVETAAKKGENVARISKELGAVEKALTGREYERPKLEAPNTEQPGFPEFPRRGGGFDRGGFGRNLDGFGGRGRIVVGGADGFNATSVAVSNGNFVIRAWVNDVNYTLTGSIAATAGAKVVIKDGNKTIEAESLKKVPEAYRANVEKLLKMLDR